MLSLFRTTAVAALATTAIAPASDGAMMTYIHEGTAIVGSLAGVTFTDARFTITATAASADIQSFGSGFVVEHAAASIEIEGVGTFDFITATETFVNNGSELVGFSRAGLPGDLYNGPSDGAFAAYALDTAIGPIAGEGDLLQWSDPVQTTGGRLFFSNQTIDGSFTAIPTPGAAGLLAVAGVVAARRRRG